MSVKVRYRPSKNKTKVYVDIYIGGKRYQKGLNLYLVPETDVFAVNKNAETRLIIDTMVADYESQIKKGTFDFETFKHGKDTAIDKVFADFISSKNAVETQKSYQNNINMIKKYAGAKLTIQSFANREFLIGLIQHFRETLAPNTVILRVQSLKNFIGYLLDMRLITHSVWSELPKHLLKNKSEDVSRSYLTIEELKQFANSNIPDSVKMPFLLSSYTGLRRSDVFSLKFSDIREGVIYLKQQKTQSYNQIPLSKQAISILNYQQTLRTDTDVVFADVPSTSLHRILTTRCKELFDKHIHFHCGRHSFAINSLSLGMNIVTLQSFLGHAKIEMTLRYAKVLPADKIKAIEIFNNL